MFFNTELSEEEQTEIFRSWLKKSLPWILGIITIVAASIVFSYYWKGSITSHNEEASMLFYDINQESQHLENADIALITPKLDSIKKDYADTTYLVFSTLDLAKVLVAKKEIAKAETELKWLLKQKIDELLIPVIAYRISLLQWQQEQHDIALKTIEQYSTDATTNMFKELKADILADKGDSDQARMIWEELSKDELNRRTRERLLNKIRNAL